MLFYQLGVSAALLPLVSLALREPGIIALTPVTVASLAFQSIVVAFASYLTWFWLLTTYLAGRLAVFSFMAPLFGVAFGHLILGDPITPVSRPPPRWSARALHWSTSEALLRRQRQRPFARPERPR